MGNWPNTYLGLPLHENVEWTSLATLIEAVLPTSRDDKWCWLLENGEVFSTKSLTKEMASTKLRTFDGFFIDICRGVPILKRLSS